MGSKRDYRGIKGANGAGCAAKARFTMIFLKAALLFALAAALAAAGASISSALASAKRHLGSAERQLADSMTLLKNGEERLARERALKGLAGLKAAQVSFDEPTLRFAAAIPFIGDNIAAIEDVTVAARRTAEAGLELIDLYGELESIGNRWRKSGAIDLGAMDAAKRKLDRAASKVDIALANLGRSRRRCLIPAIGENRARAEEKIADFKAAIDKGRALAAVLPDVLGRRGERKYFLAIQNNAELRATGGLIGNYGIISAERGKLSLDSFDEIHSLKRPGGAAVAAPKDFIDRYGSLFSTSPTVWVNANASPDFPTSAGVISNLYRESTGEAVDGVVAIDPVGLSYLLRATGPIDLPEMGVNVSSDNAVKWTLSDAYARYGNREERKDSLKSLARAVWDRVLEGRIGDVGSLVGALTRAIEEKHLMIYVSDPKEESSIQAAGAGGEMKRVKGDYLLVDVENYGMNKVDYYLKESVAHEVELRSDGSARMVTTVELFNGAPQSGLPEYVAGRAFPGRPPGTNDAYVSVFVPLGSRLMGAFLEKERATVEIFEERQKTVYSLLVRIPPGERRRARFEYVSRKVMTGDGDETEYSLFIQKQPLVNDALYAVKVHSSAHEPISGSFKFGDSGIEAGGKLNRDVSLKERFRAK